MQSSESSISQALNHSTEQATVHVSPYLPAFDKNGMVGKAREGEIVCRTDVCQRVSSIVRKREEVNIRSKNAGFGGFKDILHSDQH